MRNLLRTDTPKQPGTTHTAPTALGGPSCGVRAPNSRATTRSTAPGRPEPRRSTFLRVTRHMATWRTRSPCATQRLGREAVTTKRRVRHARCTAWRTRSRDGCFRMALENHPAADASTDPTAHMVDAQPPGSTGSAATAIRIYQEDNRRPEGSSLFKHGVGKVDTTDLQRQAWTATGIQKRVCHSRKLANSLIIHSRGFDEGEMKRTAHPCLMRTESDCGQRQSGDEGRCATFEMISTTSALRHAQGGCDASHFTTNFIPIRRKVNAPDSPSFLNAVSAPAPHNRTPAS
jgi:hypothetical protein